MALAPQLTPPMGRAARLPIPLSHLPLGPGIRALHWPIHALARMRHPRYAVSQCPRAHGGGVGTRRMRKGVV